MMAGGAHAPNDSVPPHEASNLLMVDAGGGAHPFQAFPGEGRCQTHPGLFVEESGAFFRRCLWHLLRIRVVPVLLF